MTHSDSSTAWERNATKATLIQRIHNLETLLAAATDYEDALVALLADWEEYLDIEDAHQGPEGYTAAIRADALLRRLRVVPSESPPQVRERGVL